MVFKKVVQTVYGNKLALFWCQPYTRKKLFLWPFLVDIGSSLAGARDTAFPVIKDKATTETRPNPISHLNREENREGEQEFSSNFVALGVRTSLCQSPAGIYFVTLNRDKSLILASIEEIQDCVKLATALWLGERREGCIDKWQEGVRPKSLFVTIVTNHHLKLKDFITFQPTITILESF